MRPPPDRELLVDPPPTSWDELELDDQLLLQPLLGKTIEAWRQQLRQELARRVDALDPARPWICLGHQPLPMHPGIWVKRWLADAIAARRGGQAVAVWLDLEPAGEIRWPAVRGELVEEVSLRLPPLWHLPVPGAEIQAQLDSLALPSTRETSTAPAWRWIRALLRRWEDDRLPNLIEVSQSELFFSETMQRLLTRMVEEPERLHRCYNELLAAYRAERGIRTAANPFPDLKKRGDRVELPFWVYCGERRETLYTPRGDSPLVPPLIPKGALLATVKRLLLSDLYLHGTGGASYEPFSERLIETCFGVQVPRFVVASASFALDQGEHAELEQELLEVQQLEHVLQHNPDRLVGRAGLDHDDEVKGLVEARRGAIARMASTNDKKGLAAEIRRCNAALRQRLQPWWLGIEERCTQLRTRLEQVAPMARRDLPVLYHSIDDLIAAFSASLPSL
jgi:hypothetical protein